MLKAVIILSLLAVFFVCDSSGQRFIQPTFRPPPRKPVLIRVRRSNEEPLWLNQGDIPRAPATGDHPFLPNYIDDIKLDPNTRVARSLRTTSVSRTDTRQTLSTATGPTYPGYHRIVRNIPDRPGWPTLPPFNPKPGPRSPWEPKPVRFPILARN